MSTRILIADDHGLLRSGIVAIFDSEPDMEVVGEVGTAEDAVVQCNILQPDVVLMDISMPQVGGIEACRRIAAMCPRVRVLMLTMHEDVSMVRESINAGACGYILKKALKSELMNAIHSVKNGDLYIHPSLARELFREAVKYPNRGTVPAEPLTTREIEVLRLIAQGYTNSQIGEKLFISVRTVEYHRANLMAKLNLDSRVDLIRYANDHNIT